MPSKRQIGFYAFNLLATISSECPLDFKESANLRNDVTHKGRIVTKAEAKKSHKAASDLVAYLNAR
jgi:hypothetical protein